MAVDPDAVSVEHRTYLYARLKGCGVPEHIHEGLVEYITARRPVGDFLTAVLSNDLKEACVRADYLNGPALQPIVQFLYNHCPAPAWGSPEKVAEWLADPEKPPVVFD